MYTDFVIQTCYKTRHYRRDVHKIEAKFFYKDVQGNEDNWGHRSKESERSKRPSCLEPTWNEKIVNI